MVRRSTQCEPPPGVLPHWRWKYRPAASATTTFIRYYLDKRDWHKETSGFLSSVRTNFGAGLLVVTSARPILAARGAPCKRHEDEFWVADSDATENMTQGSFHLNDYTPPPPANEVESAGGVILPVAGYGCLRLLVDQDNDTFKGATRELTLDRVAHVPKLGRHNPLSTKRLTTAFDAPMYVYPAAATIRPRFGHKTLVSNWW